MGNVGEKPGFHLFLTKKTRSGVLIGVPSHLCGDLNLFSPFKNISTQ